MSYSQLPPLCTAQLQAAKTTFLLCHSFPPSDPLLKSKILLVIYGHITAHLQLLLCCLVMSINTVLGKELIYSLFLVSCN